MEGINPDIYKEIPGKENDRNSIYGEMFWVYIAITETIAWCYFTPEDFQRYLRQESLMSALTR